MLELQSKFEKEIYFTIDYNDLNDILRDEYECPNYEAILDCPNDSNIKIIVTGALPEYKLDSLKEFLETKSQNYDTTELLLNDLCTQGKIEPGSYLINVSW